MVICSPITQEKGQVQNRHNCAQYASFRGNVNELWEEFVECAESELGFFKVEYHAERYEYVAERRAC